jgi:hypothetical protein
VDAQRAIRGQSLTIKAKDLSAAEGDVRVAPEQSHRRPVSHSSVDGREKREDEPVGLNIVRQSVLDAEGDMGSLGKRGQSVVTEEGAEARHLRIVSVTLEVLLELQDKRLGRVL